MSAKIMECDLLVLGAGGSGLVAAVRAFDLTGMKVIVLEKSKKTGGSTYFASVMGDAGPVRDSKWQKDAGYDVSESPDISGQWFDWLVSKGGAETYFNKIPRTEATGKLEGLVLEPRFASFRPNGYIAGEGIHYPDRWEKYKNMPDGAAGIGRLGSWVVEKLTDCCNEQGIQILTETRARKFLTDDTGRVTAVMADTRDGQLLVNCTACIVAAGGFGADKDLLKKYYPEQFDDKIMHSLCPPAMTGDCILAAGEIGAYIDPTIRSLDHPGGFYAGGISPRHPWSTSMGSLMGGTSVHMNLDGKRWHNEAGRGGGDISAQRDGIACAVVDSNIVEMVGSQLESRENMEVMKESLEWEAAMDDAGASGHHTKKADTLVELALKMKADPRAFVDTIERYNKFCETGKDLDFGKPAGMLQPIKKPPFYAIFGHRWSQCSKGRNGIAVNTKFQALNTKGEVIPGLYAAGDGCTIFGGFVIGTPKMGFSPLTEEEKAARAALSRDVALAFAAAPGTPKGGTSMMEEGVQNASILKGKSSPCGGLGPAFISGYSAGTFAAVYLKSP